MATSLLDLPRVEEADYIDDIDLDELGTTEIDGQKYGRVLAYTCSIFCHGDSPQSIEVTLGRKFSSFTATSAVLDTASGDHRLTVTLDGAESVVFDFAPGRPAEVDLDVTGHSRMRIDLYSPGEIVSPLQCGASTAGGVGCGTMPGAALADPLLLP